MTPYQTKLSKLSGTNYKEIKRKAWRIFREVARTTKRRPYLRSTYFIREKIFFDFFWQHLSQKTRRDRMRRLLFFNCAIELIKNSRIKPRSEINRNNKNEILHKFYGKTKGGGLFCVHIKENKKTGRKYFMSCFPVEKASFK